jgi:hypothetical protein
MKCRQPTIEVSARKCRRPVSYYLGSADSPLCLLLSLAEDLSLKVLPRLLAVPKWNLLTNPLSLYGRRVRRTGTAGCTGTTCPKHAKMSASFEMLAAADILTLFLMKSQNPNSAHKCPITSIQVCTESQKLSEFSCITSGSLKRGCLAF